MKRVDSFAISVQRTFSASTMSINYCTLYYTLLNYTLIYKIAFKKIF